MATSCLSCGPWDPHRSMWDLSSQTRDGIPACCIGRWILNHWTTREVLGLIFFHRGPIDSDIKALSPRPNFFFWVSQSSMKLGFTPGQSVLFESSTQSWVVTVLGVGWGSLLPAFMVFWTQYWEFLHILHSLHTESDLGWASLSCLVLGRD